MAKVIVERPRFGSRMPTKGKGYGRRMSRIDWDDQPKREGMKVRGGNRKMLNEHLSPLRRYLAKQVGRPWNKVFAGICKYIDRSNPVQDHVRDHLDDYVTRNVVYRDGEAFHTHGYRVYSLFFVCPRTGTLKKSPRSYPWRRLRNDRKFRIRFVGRDEALVRLNRVWHWITYKEIKNRVWEPITRRWHPLVAEIQHDILLKRNLFRDQAIQIYSRPIYAVTARLASKREVRGVVSSYPRTNVVR